MDSDANHYVDNWTGCDTQATVEVSAQAMGMGTTSHFATLRMERVVLGTKDRDDGGPVPVLGSLTIKFNRGDLARMLREVSEQLEVAPVPDRPFSATRSHGGL